MNLENKIFISNILGVSYTPDGNYFCLFDGVTENAVIYQINKKALQFIKILKGLGIFLSDDHILMFYNNSGYGYCNTDAYLFQLSSKLIRPFCYANYKQ